VAFEAGNLSLFGIDLGNLGQGLRRGWDGLKRWPLLAWFNPAEPVLAHWPDGSRRTVLGASAMPAAGEPEFHALVLSPDVVLSRRLHLPHLADAEIEAALELELQAESPFPLETLDWGWRLDRVDDSGLEVSLAFVARDHVDAQLAERQQLLPGRFEVWVDADGPLVLRGRGEAPRLARGRARRRRLLALVLLNVMLVGIWTAVPYWQLRQRTIDAQGQLEALHRAANPYLEARATLVEADARAAAIESWRAGQADMPALLHRLTLLLPDTAHLKRFDAEGRRVRITGSAADGAGLMDSLRADPQVSQLRALSPIVRGRDGLDNFYLEFQLLPAARRPPDEPAITKSGVPAP
jgi:hypothetical protein